MTTNLSHSFNNDVILGNKQINLVSESGLERAIEKILKASDGNSELVDIIEDLAEYITERPNRQIIGIEEKLLSGGRDDLIEDAIYLKNKFEKRLAKRQMSLSEQKVYIQVLANINSAFNQKIRPLILEGSCQDP